MADLYEKKNFCKTEGPMSVCNAKGGLEQEKCKFWEPATRAKGKCMYWKFKEYCDCLKAQMDVEK